MGKSLLTAKERRRAALLADVKRGKISLHKAAELLSLSYRQAKRCYARYVWRVRRELGIGCGAEGRIGAWQPRSAQRFWSATTAAAMRTFQRYVARHGLPLSLYVDRDSIYRITRDATVEEALASEAPLTQFGQGASRAPPWNVAGSAREGLAAGGDRHPRVRFDIEGDDQ